MKDFIECLKLPPTIMASVSLVSGCVLFLPDKLLMRMGLNDLKSPYNMIVGIVFLLSTALFIVYLSQAVYMKLKEQRFQKKFPELFDKVMRELADDERLIVYMLNQELDKTAPLPISSGTVLRLKSKLIIQLTTTLAFTGPEMEMPFMLTSATLKYLGEHQDYFSNIGDVLGRMNI